jgi:hypothetical protein
MGIHDSEDLAWRDWRNSADYDESDNDRWPREWGRAYVHFAATEKRDYLRSLGLNVLPTVGWAERGSGNASGHGNSVPRFHLTWGTGPEVVRVFREPLLDAERRGTVRFAFRHRVDELLVEDGAVVGVRGSILAPCDDLGRGVASPRDVVDTFEYRGAAVAVTSGGIGGKPRPGASFVADRAVGGVPGRHGGRRAGARRRTDDRYLDRRRCDDGQHRPDVALHRGNGQLGSDLARSRYPYHSRPQHPVVRCGGTTTAHQHLPGAPTTSPHWSTSDAPDTATAGSSSTRPSPTRSSSSPDPSRILISPTSPYASCSARSGQERTSRYATSWSTERTGSSPTTWSHSWRG